MKRNGSCRNIVLPAGPNRDEQRPGSRFFPSWLLRVFPALSPVQALFKGRAKKAAQIFSGGIATAITFFLFLASLQYVLEMKPLGKILVYGIPTWVIQLILPIGFALILLRLVWHASKKYG